MNLNKAMVIGNLTRDPETRTTPTGKQVSTFSIATNLIFKDKSGERKELAEFHNIVVWGKLSEICAKYLKKGSKIYMEGRLATRSWDKDGVKHYRTEIIGSEMIMLDTKGAVNSEGSQDTNVPSQAEQEQQEPTPDDEIVVENIPW